MTTTTVAAFCAAGCKHDGPHGFCTTHGEPVRWLATIGPSEPSCDCPRDVPARALPSYVYVASSWRCALQPAVVAILAAAGIEHYDFRNPPDGAGFGWEEVMPAYVPGSELVAIETYLEGIEHPRALEGFASDFAAMQRADTFVLVLPCNRSAHLELGWAVGAGKRTAILLEPGKAMVPELMYRMVDHIAPSVDDLLRWLGVGPA